MANDRRNFVKQIAAGGALMLSDQAAHAAAPANCATPGPAIKPPNLLIVFPDEMRAQAQGFMKADPVLTPRLDRFSRESRVLTQAVANYPLCTPSRGMLMTGQYPIHNGMTGNCHDYGALVGIDLSTHARCWSDVLKTQGYALGYVGKWHLDAPKEPYVTSYNNPANGTKWNDWTPPERRHGFEFWYAYGAYNMHMAPMYWTNASDRDHPIHPAQWGPEHEADVAIRYLRNEGGKLRDPAKPFALVVSMGPPHSPYDQTPQKYLDLYAGQSSRDLHRRANVDWNKQYQHGYGPEAIKSYFAMVSGVDEQFGRILDALDESGLRDNTLVVFFSDHGACLGAHGEPTKNNPFEESMRIPMMFRLPGRVSTGHDNLLMSMPDVYPTVLGLLGLADKTPATVEGTDWSQRFMTGKGQGASSQLYLSVPYGGGSFGKRGVRTESHTLVIQRNDKQPLRYTLFDNVADPLQLRDIAADQPALVKDLVKRELLPWLEATGDSWRPAEFSTAGRGQSAAGKESGARSSE